MGISFSWEFRSHGNFVLRGRTLRRNDGCKRRKQRRGTPIRLLRTGNATEMHIARKYTLVAQRVLIDRVYYRALGLTRPILRRQPKGVGTVALTFDDGPSPKTTPFILRRAGAGRRAKATFFLSGVRVAAHPELAAAIVAAGHAVYQPRVGARERRGHRGRRPRWPTPIGSNPCSPTLRPTPTPYLVRFPYNAGCQTRLAASCHPGVSSGCPFRQLGFVDPGLDAGGGLRRSRRRSDAQMRGHGRHDRRARRFGRFRPADARGSVQRPRSILSSSVAMILLLPHPVGADLAARGLRGDILRTEPARDAA